MDKDDVTLLIAILGLTVACFTAGWTVYRDVRDRGRIDVSFYPAWGVDWNAPLNLDLDYPPVRVLGWKITNIGRRPLIVTQIGGSLYGSEFELDVDVILPKTFEPGETLSGTVDDIGKLDPDKIRTFSVRDSLGRRYEAPWQQVATVRQAIRELADRDKS